MPDHPQIHQIFASSQACRPTVAMALVLSEQSSTRPLPEKQLIEAIDDFQGILTDDQRTALKTIKTIPDADAVLVFTAELDYSSRHSKGRSIATRLHSVLQSVREFSAVIDTFVSSNPEIAALIWGSVKLTIQVRRVRNPLPQCEPLTLTRSLSTSLLTMKPCPTSLCVLRPTVHDLPSTRFYIRPRTGFKQPCAISTPPSSVAASMR